MNSIREKEGRKRKRIYMCGCVYKQNFLCLPCLLLLRLLPHFPPLPVEGKSVSRCWLVDEGCNMQRLRSFRASIMRSTRTPELKKKALNSLSAVQDTYYSTKDTFERHRVVFTVGTSIASVATAWIGYTMRHLHDTRVDRRLDSIEQAQMQKNHYIEQDEIKKIVSSGNVSTAACVAAAGTSLVVGYALGWRGGKWYATRKFRREQMKLLGQIEPRKLRFQFIRKPFKRLKFQENIANRLAALRKAKSIPENSAGQIRNPC